MAMARRMALLAILALLVVAAAGYGALRYLTAVPGEPHRGALPPLTAAEVTLAAALERHVEAVVAREQNVDPYDKFETVAHRCAAAIVPIGPETLCGANGT